MLRYVALVQPFQGAQFILAGALRGAGDGLSPMIITISSFVVFRQLFLLIGTQFIDHPLFVGMSYPAGWVVASISTTIVYHKGKWEQKVKTIAAAQ